MFSDRNNCVSLPKHFYFQLPFPVGIPVNYFTLLHIIILLYFFNLQECKSFIDLKYIHKTKNMIYLAYSSTKK